jgi:cysteine desulfurase
LLDEMGIAVSSGSACSSNGDNPASHVLQAIGLNQFEARGSIRLSIGRYNTENEIDIFLTTLTNSIKKLNSIFSII